MTSIPPASAAAPTRQAGPSRSASNPPEEHTHKRTIIDLDQVELAFKSWLAAIRRKGSKRTDGLQQLHIQESVFEPYAAVHPRPTASSLQTAESMPLVTDIQFHAQVDTIRQAIHQGQHPTLNPKGSSGSYFCKDATGKVVGIFKPKDEEPYGRLNPKWTKWFHRHFVAPVFGFGRSCLIPNLSYLSEEAASVLDRRLATHIVPRTQVVDLASPSFFYDWIDRSAASGKKPRPLPDKSGSFQLFGRGFTDASDFLIEHPWPGLGEAQPVEPKHRSRGLKLFKLASRLCGRAEAQDPSAQEDLRLPELQDGDFVWTRSLMDDLRLQLERLVILDFLMRNTDRGLDNFMLKVSRDPAHAQAIPATTTPSIISEQPGAAPAMSQIGPPYALRRPKSVVELSDQSHVNILAIDNSLAFPQHYPRGWRSFAYGWLFLPVSMIGLPWSDQARQHFLPLLTSKEWWEGTSQALRETFSKDPDFNANQFSKQLAVVKGQGLLLVQSLSNSSEGPLELCQRPPCLVWDDVVENYHPQQDQADLSQSMLDHSSSVQPSSSYSEGVDETASLLPDGRSRSSRKSRFMRRLRRGTTASDISGDASRPKQLSSKEHADSTREDSLASGFSLLEEVNRPSRQLSKKRSSSFGTMPDIGERRASEQTLGHSRIFSSSTVLYEEPRKRVIVERVEIVQDRPYFAMC